MYWSAKTQFLSHNSNRRNQAASESLWPAPSPPHPPTHPIFAVAKALAEKNPSSPGTLCFHFRAHPLKERKRGREGEREIGREGGT